MAQTFPRSTVAKSVPRPRGAWVIDLLIVLVLIAIGYGVVRMAARWAAPMTPNVQISSSPWALPGYAALSTLRMALAYIVALAFSLTYARLAVSRRGLERIMVPVLDILQSVPILSFLPGVVLGLVALFPHRNIGLELAAIVLIFTSQAWNLAFGFHQALRTIPRDLNEAATLYRLRFWQRFTRLELPFGMISLIWNSMMSWAGGWFFLMAAEQFRLGNRDFRLPGLGSYLATAADDGNIPHLLLGLLTLVIVIVLLDQLVWRPLVAWGERFKMEQTGAAEAPESAVLTALQRSLLLRRMRHALADMRRVREAPVAADPAPVDQPLVTDSGQTRRTNLDRLVIAVLLGMAGLFALWGLSQALPVLTGLSRNDWRLVGEGAGATLLRTMLALLIAVVWTVPLGVAIGMNPRWARRAQPLVQMVASIPATALFPALLLLLLRLPSGLNLAAILLMLLGTQWYLLFNVIAGAMAIPTDLREVSALFKISRWQRWRTLVLPAIFPYLITGLITASGGAWNASIVAEYVNFGGKTRSTIGLGSLIARSANDGRFGLLFAATLTMSAIVVLVNRLLWRRLYRIAEERYRLD